MEGGVAMVTGGGAETNCVAMVTDGASMVTIGSAGGEGGRGGCCRSGEGSRTSMPTDLC